MSMMPAFLPRPLHHTSLLRVGSRFRCTRDDLYEQCSLHITLKIPSSVSDGSRPSEALIRSYSSGVMPWSFMISGVMAEACVVAWGYFYFRTKPESYRRFHHLRSAALESCNPVHDQCHPCSSVVRF